MKTLLLLRHAKSSWADTSQSDHDRPLKKRGIKAATFMGQWMRVNMPHPDHIFCSSSTRTQQTLDRLCESWGTEIPTTTMQELYHCDASQFLTVLRTCSDHFKTVLIIGHNPGLEVFVQRLSGRFEELPTASLVCLELPIDSWPEMSDTVNSHSVSITRPRELFQDLD